MTVTVIVTGIYPEINRAGPQIMGVIEKARSLMSMNPCVFSYQQQLVLQLSPHHPRICHLLKGILRATASQLAPEDFVKYDTISQSFFTLLLPIFS